MSSLRRSRRIAALTAAGYDAGVHRDKTRVASSQSARPRTVESGCDNRAVLARRSHSIGFPGRSRRPPPLQRPLPQPLWSAPDNLRWFDCSAPPSPDGFPLGASGWGAASGWAGSVDAFDRLLGMLGVIPPALLHLLRFLGYSNEPSKRAIALTRMALLRTARRIWLTRCSRRKAWLRSGCTKDRFRPHEAWRGRRRKRQARLAVKRKKQREASARRATIKRRRAAQERACVDRQVSRWPEAIIDERRREVPGGLRHEYKVRWRRRSTPPSWRLASHCAFLPCFQQAIRGWEGSGSRLPPLTENPASASLPAQGPISTERHIPAGEEAREVTLPNGVAALCGHAMPRLPDMDALPDEYPSEPSGLETSSPASSDTDDEELGLLERAARGDADDAPPKSVWIPTEILRERWVRGQRQYRVRWLGHGEPQWGRAAAYDRQRLFRSVVAAWRADNPHPPAKKRRPDPDGANQAASAP